MKSDAVTCPIEKVTRVLSDTWTLLIIRQLLRNTSMRFCELERALNGISTRTLTLKLQTLTEEGVVVHNEHNYLLSEKGKGLKPVIIAIEKVSIGFK